MANQYISDECTICGLKIKNGEKIVHFRTAKVIPNPYRSTRLNSNFQVMYNVGQKVKGGIHEDCWAEKIIDNAPPNPIKRNKRFTKI